MLESYDDPGLYAFASNAEAERYQRLIMEAFESGQDSNFAITDKARIHAGQAIGLLAGAIQASEGNTSIKLIAAKDDIDLQAQSDEMKFQSKKNMKLVSANANIDFAAAKKGDYALPKVPSNPFETMAPHFDFKLTDTRAKDVLKKEPAAAVASVTTGLQGQSDAA
ncbi:DUF2345 domain-containing protein [Quatrionicoccus australiensis]|uniref:DUF2345 domain-containing protein n=1 Tax=Quatrionicoccus australiensis TaxID=138118 RepID=UPI001CFAA5C2|nr:DUF2345 domain-containing protein [Quatrionicoccus australiensis]